MQWIKIETGLPSKLEVIKLCQELEMNRREVIGLLTEFWIFADANITDGDMGCVTIESLNDFFGVTHFAQAMHKVGWLEISEGNISIPNWDRHHGQSAKKRAESARTSALHRQRKKNSVTEIDHDGDTTDVTNCSQSMSPREREEKEKNIYISAKRFTPPKPQQVADYAKERGLEIDAEKFCDFYESKGWLVGKTKMKDWKAAVRNWCKSSDQKSKPSEPELLPWQKPFVVT